MREVLCSREDKVIPTYLPGADEKNPVFYESRNHQGASGRVFPMPICDTLSDTVTDVTYNALRLENEYIDVTLLPELGGRIYSALDKTNGYDFIYKNRKIKPQQIGLCGPWISGGIEFNWPQHHRPTTFKPVDWFCETNPDNSKTVWMGEVEPLNRTKGMVGITVYPGNSYIKAKIRFFNRTPYPQTFMWWANLAVAVNKDWKAVFPEDIHWASGHAWASTSRFPVIRGMYRGLVDFKDGVDVRCFPNVPLGDSFFTYGSKYDFLSGYDFGRDSGIVHVADRHISPGKKMFTWGVSDFSRAWFKNLSDDDGPYVELMTGVYTCNQPDFAWIMPYEYKTAEQYWYPIREIGEVKSANINGAIGFELEDDTIRIAINTTELRKDCRVVIRYKDTVLYEKVTDISPDKPFKDVCTAAGESPCAYFTALYASDGRELVSYRPEDDQGSEVPAPLTATPPETDMNNAEEIYYHALHLYQYRHPYYDPLDYVDRGLALDSNHVNLNHLKGKILMERGMFKEAETFLNKAIAVSTQRNPHPYDTEPYYTLGVLQKLNGRFDEAYENFFKAAWGFANKSASYLALAEISCLRGEYDRALEHLEEAQLANGANFRAQRLKAALLRRLGRPNEALPILDSLLRTDPLDYIARYENSLCRQAVWQDPADSTLDRMLERTYEYSIDIALEYAAAGFWQDARQALKKAGANAPVIVDYYAAFYSGKAGDTAEEARVLDAAAKRSPVGCLHSRLDSIAVLRNAMNKNRKDAVAPYLLGNIYYGVKNVPQAVAAFEASVRNGAAFPTAYRNLAIAYFDKLGRRDEAGELIRTAFAMDDSDPRVFFEYAQYLRATNAPAQERLELFERYPQLARQHDDTYAKYVSTLIETGHYEEAKARLLERVFHPYEGGEGIVTNAFSDVSILLAQQALAANDPERALRLLKECDLYPDNFNSQRAPKTGAIAHLEYHKGLAYEAMGNKELARQAFEKAAADVCATPAMAYYAGKSLEKLGQADKAKERYEWLLSTAEQLIQNKGRYAYFTKSLVTTLPFEHDTAMLDRELAFFLIGLASMGLHDDEKAKLYFNKALRERSTDYMARICRDRL